MKRLPVYNWLDVKTANKRQADGIYDKRYQVIGIDPRLGEKRLVKIILHEMLHYLSDTYPKIIKKLSERQVRHYTIEILKLIKKR